MGRWESREAWLARTGARMGQDGQTAEPGRMVSHDGGPGGARMGRQQSQEGWLARTGGLGWARMGGQGRRIG